MRIKRTAGGATTQNTVDGGIGVSFLTDRLRYLVFRAAMIHAVGVDFNPARARRGAPGAHMGGPADGADGRTAGPDL